MPIAILYLCIASLFLGAAPLPYGYYSLLRWFAFGVFAYAAIISHHRKYQSLPWVFGLVAIIFNPLFKIHFTKEMWVLIDLAAGFLLLVTYKDLINSEPTLSKLSSPEILPTVTLDGSNYEHAIPVSSVEEEYAWIEAHFPGAKRTTQEVHSTDGGLVDVLEIQTVDGSTRKVYFDMNGILAQWVLARKSSSENKRL